MNDSFRRTRKFLFLTLIVLLAAITRLSAQDIENLQRNLKMLQQQAILEDSLRNRRVQAYLQQEGIPRWFRTDQEVVYFLEDVSPWGHPQYIRTMNAGAARTVGIDKLRSGGGFGLNLTGAGMRVGVWEVFGVFQTHQEFDNRVLTQEAAGEIDNHATHVAGTLMASGVNPDARGMAYEARALLWTANGDLNEMIAASSPDQNTLLVSNHSYGPGLGWEFSNGSWRWFGDASVSESEDYRFGFYDGKTRAMDQLAFNAPYYTIVKSAGNDRSDVGDGSRPADGPYDIIGTWGTAKNIITVGAVNKINSGYEDPSDVTMSSFSSWGPTDDGRIKPDIVAAGVSLLSAVSSATDAYGQLSGTSMSAPNAAGAFLLLQQLAKQETNNYMRSATLKALIAHTANKATNADGPNYRFGWGLLSADRAARVILDQDDLNIFMKELTLQNGEVYELPINPVAGEKITATISWTDPAGEVSEVSLNPTDLKLVNDLDLRIVDAAGNEALPWILDPSSPSLGATRGDNFRDNIEKIEFNNPEPRRYVLRVSHKNSLQNGNQRFSLILTYQSRHAEGDRRTVYWIGGDGAWENGNNWSLSSGGDPAGPIPVGSDRVVIDENSFSGDGQAISLNGNAQIYDFSWLAKGDNGISLNGNTLRIDNDVLVSSESFSVSSQGTFAIRGAGDFDLGPNALPQLSLVFDAAGGMWQEDDLLIVGSIRLNRGSLTLDGATVEVAELATAGTNAKTLNIRNADIRSLTNVDFAGSGLTLNSEGVQMATAEGGIYTFSAPGITIEGALTLPSGLMEMSGQNLRVYEMIVGGSIVTSNSMSFDTLNMDGGSNLLIASGSVLNINQLWEVNSSAQDIVQIASTNQSEIATIDINSYQKFCFGNMNIISVNYTGIAKVTVGASSTLTNAAGWLTRECDDVLFADFTYSFNCVQGLTYLINQSSGNISSVTWDLGDGNTTTTQDAYHQYMVEGEYDVTLTIVNGGDVESVVKTVPIGENVLQTNKVVLSDNRLVSERPAESYQWFREGLPIEGANARIYNLENLGGEFFVLTINGSCNNISDTVTVEVTGIEDIIGDPELAKEVEVYPIPVKDELKVQWPASQIPIRVSLMDLHGRTLYIREFIPESGIFAIPMQSLPNGLYWLRIENDRGQYIRKIVK